MTSRRAFITGMIATGLTPRLTWADAGGPAFLSSARTQDGAYVLVGLTDSGAITFQIPLPGRGHAAATHPTRPEAVAFARRPGVFAMVINCVNGTQSAALNAPRGRHFYGHGAFSRDGRTLFTTENDLDTGAGIVGVWDATRSYRRIGEFASGGIGPHDIKLMPGGDALVIANGGIETHPDSGRTKLNIATMQPNLSYVSLSGGVQEQMELPASLHKNSIRHLAARADGLVAFAMQWQGAKGDNPPLLGLHKRGQRSTLITAPPEHQRKLNGYVGSIAITRDARQVAITSPRGGIAQVFQIASGAFVTTLSVTDICGISAGRKGLQYTAGTGQSGAITGKTVSPEATHPLQWDNHLVPVSA